MVRTRLCAAALLVMAAALTGCDEPAGRACTEIGCSDGLYVALRATPGTEVQVVASTSTGDERTASCVVDSNGSCLIGFYGFVPEIVTLAVSGGDHSVSVTLRPAYERLQPNGAGCPPICTQARVELNLE